MPEIPFFKSHNHLVLILIGLSNLTIVVQSLCANDSNGPQVYDLETDRCYPISKTSLQYDSVFLQSKIDEKEFSPEFINSLLNHCHDPMPTYKDFLIKAWISFKEFGLNWTRYPFTLQMFYRYLMAINYVHILQALILAIILTLLRLFVERQSLPPLVNTVGVNHSAARKIIESGWKAVWYSVMWFVSFKILIMSGRKDFYYPLCILHGNEFQVGYFDIPLPTEYYYVYMLQIGFYIHSLWTVFFIDTWRKDSKVTAIHHVLTCLLLQGSIINRFHRIGLLVLFFHDVSDIFLEIAKINSCLRFRYGKLQKQHVILGNVFFFIFTATWVVFRLYWFPLKVLHATTWGAYILAVGREARGYLFFNVMLWTLFLLHLYWFSLIVRMAIRLVFSPSGKANDVREYDSDNEKIETPKQNGHCSMSNGHSKPERSKND